MNKPRELNATLVNELKALLGERATIARGICEQHGKDESYFPYAAPDAVARVMQSGELSIKKANRVIEESLIRRALDKTGGNRTAAARLLEISHRALLYKIKDYGV